MFKNASIYVLTNAELVHTDAELAAELREFTPCGLTQEKSVGFTPVRGLNGAMIESINGQWLMKVAVETKTVPADVLNRKFKQHLESVEESTGRKLGRKESKWIKEEVKGDLLRAAFPKRSDVNVWVDPVAMRMVIDSASTKTVDEVLGLMFGVISANCPGLVVHRMENCCSVSAEALMNSLLLTKDQPTEADDLMPMDSFVLQDQMKATVKYVAKQWSSDEVADYISAGMTPKRLTMSFDDLISFELDDGLVLRKISIADTGGADGESNQDQLDADFFLATEVLEKLISYLSVVLKFQQPGATTQ